MGTAPVPDPAAGPGRGDEVGDHRPAVAFEVAGPVATLTMDQPATRNALSVELLAGLGAGLARAQAEQGVRVVVLSHTGAVWCSGADLRPAAAGHGQPVDPGRSVGLDGLPALLDAIQACPLPVIAAVRGHAFGGGVGLAAACDLSVVADDALLGFTEVRLGVVPAVVSVVCLPKLRRGDALELFLTGQRIPAARAAALGLVTAAVPAGDVDAAVARYVDLLVQGGPRAVAATKALVHEAGGDSTATAYRAMSALSARIFASEEATEGRTAFAQRRPPSWVAPTGDSDRDSPVGPHP